MTTSNNIIKDILYSKKINYPKKKSYPKKRNHYKNTNYSDFDMEKIMKECITLKENDPYYISAILDKYPINRKTFEHKLRRYIEEGNKSLNDNRGKHTRLFTENEEKILIEYIKREYIERKLPFDTLDLKILARKFWIKNKSHNLCEEENNSRLFKASDGWCSDFKRRWGLSRKPTYKHINETHTNAIEIESFQKKLREAIKEIGPDNIYNYDETRWNIINKVNSTIGIRGSANTTLTILGNEKDGFTAGFCINLKGFMIKPIIIIKGGTSRCLKKLGSPNDLILTFSKSGWISKEIMIMLFDLIYEHSNMKNSVLILDKYSVHTTEEIQMEAEIRNIQLIYVPTNMTYCYQPLDVGNIIDIIKIFSKKALEIP
jgi:transposase